MANTIKMTKELTAKEFDGRFENLIKTGTITNVTVGNKIKKSIHDFIMNIDDSFIEKINDCAKLRGEDSDKFMEEMKKASLDKKEEFIKKVLNLIVPAGDFSFELAKVLYNNTHADVVENKFSNDDIIKTLNEVKLLSCYVEHEPKSENAEYIKALISNAVTEMMNSPEMNETFGGVDYRKILNELLKSNTEKFVENWNKFFAETKAEKIVTIGMNVSAHRPENIEGKYDIFELITTELLNASLSVAKSA